MLRLLPGRESQVLFDCDGLVSDGRSNEISESGLTAKSTTAPSAQLIFHKAND